MAHLRFGSPHAVAPCLYSRGDGTLSYFFSVDRVVALAAAAGLRCLACEYHTVCNRNRRSGVEVRALACVGCLCSNAHRFAIVLYVQVSVPLPHTPFATHTPVACTYTTATARTPSCAGSLFTRYCKPGEPGGPTSA
jgi:hypothetical protein